MEKVRSDDLWEFFSSQKTLSHGAWSPSRDTGTLKTSLSHWCIFPPHHVSAVQIGIFGSSVSESS